MIRRITTILLLLSFGVFPATAHACHIAALVCQTLGQNEENCCASEGECHMDMSKMSHEQDEADSNQQCLCTVSETKDSSEITASVPNSPVLDDSLQAFLPEIFSVENPPVEIFLSSTPHHKSNKTYLKNSCLRL